MGEGAVVTKTLKKVARRLMILRTERSIVHFLLLGLAAGFTVLAVYKLTPLPFSVFGLIALLIGLSIIIGVGYGLSHRVTPFAAGKLTDLKMGLKERLSSAIEFLPRVNEYPVYRAVVKDAASHAKKVNSAEVFPHRFPKETKFLAMAIVGVALLSYVPEYRSPAARERMETMEIMKKEGKRLKEIAKEVEKKAKEKKFKEAQKVAERTEELSSELEKAKMEKKSALAKISKLTEEITRRQMSLDVSRSLQSAAKQLAMSNLSRKLSDALKRGDFTEAEKELKSLAQRLKKGDLDESELEKLRKALEEASASMKGMEGLAQLLARASSALKDLDTSLASDLLLQALKELENIEQIRAEVADLEKFLSELEKAKKHIALGKGICPLCGSALLGGESCPNCGLSPGSGPRPGPGGGPVWEGPIQPGESGDTYWDIPPTSPEGVEEKEPERIGEKTPSLLTGEIGQGEPPPGIPIPGLVSDGEAATPYADDYGQVMRQAEDALSKEKIPLGYQEYVRNYFESLQVK